MSSIHVICGSDEGTVSEEALKLHNKITPEGGDEFSREIIDGTVANADEALGVCSQAIESLQTLPLFGGEKTIWLKNVNFLASDRTSTAEATKEGAEKLLECLKSGLPDGVSFLISGSSFNKSRSLCKFLFAEGESQIHNKADTSKDGWQEEIATIVSKRANETELTFSQEALDLFVNLVGDDTRLIAGELKKIDTYLGDKKREVNVEDIRLLVPMSHAGIVFEIGRALQKKDAARAFEIIDKQLARNESAIGLIRAGVIPAVRSLFMAGILRYECNIQSGNYNQYVKSINSLPENERAFLPQKKTGGVNGWPLFLASAQVRNFTLAKLKEAMNACLAADKCLVTTGLDHRAVLHRLVGTICAS